MLCFGNEFILSCKKFTIVVFFAFKVIRIDQMKTVHLELPIQWEENAVDHSIWNHVG